jgi:hypothetical protein
MSVEEWWGRVVEKRGSVQLQYISEISQASIKSLSTEDVAELYRSEGVHDHPSVRGLIAGMELRRRENWTARAAIVISFAALIVSIAGSFFG